MGEAVVGGILSVEQLLQTALLGFESGSLLSDFGVFVGDLALSAIVNLVLLEFVHSMEVVNLFLAVADDSFKVAFEVSLFSDMTPIEVINLALILLNRLVVSCL